MMSQDSVVQEEQQVEVIFEQEEESTIEPPIEEWSSYLCFLEGPHINKKRQLYEAGLFAIPSEEICAKYIPLSDSSVFRHPYYLYPAVLDPGIEDAILEPVPIIIYEDDGKELYLALCKEMNETPCTIFYKQLLDEHVNLKYYGISPLGWRPMAIALEKNRIVKTIDLTYNFISEDGCYHFGNLLVSNFTITEIDFTGCRMGPNGLKLFVAFLSKNTTLKKLNLSRNKLTDAGIVHLSKAIDSGANITDINICYNALTSLSAAHLAEVLEFKNKLTSLDFSFNNLSTPRPVENLMKCFLDNEKFVEINLSWNSLTNRFKKVLDYLMQIPNIRVINLSNNNLTGVVIETIVGRLKPAKKLQVLDLSYNPLTIAEATLLLNSMRFRAVKLKKLLMDEVNVDKKFLALKERVLRMKFRKAAVITHGYVILQIHGHLSDMREIALNRAQFVCSKPARKRVDVGLMLLQINKDKKGEPIFNKDFYYSIKQYGAFQMNEDLVEELALAFPGPRSGKAKMTNIAAMADYVLRKWPDTQLPPTPPPTPPPEPPLPVKGKGKDAGKDKDKGKGKDKDKGKDKGKDKDKGKKGKK